MAGSATSKATADMPNSHQPAVFGGPAANARSEPSMVTAHSTPHAAPNRDSVAQPDTRRRNGRWAAAPASLRERQRAAPGRSATAYVNADTAARNSAAAHSAWPPFSSVWASSAAATADATRANRMPLRAAMRAG